MSEFHDEYSEALDGEFRKLEDALLSDEVRLLAPSEPVRVSPDTTVAEAVARMVDNRRAAVVIVDTTGRLTGIFTERDLLTRVVGRGLDPKGTALSAVMTPNPEVLSLRDRVAYAVHCMSVAGYRTVPLVDADGKPIAIVTVSDVIRWIANLFPTTVLNLPPGGDTLKRPGQVDSG